METLGAIMTQPDNSFIKRQQKLTNLLTAAGLDALVLNPGPSLTYLTGLHFHLMERPVVGIFGTGHPFQIILPALETQKLVGLPYEVDHTSYGEDPTAWPGIFKQVLGRYPAGKIGVENSQLRLLEFRLLEAAFSKAEFIDAGEVVAGLRMYKDEDELAHMQKAVDIAEAALRDALALVKIGMTEKELAAELVLQLLRHGSEGELPFQPIVSTGPNGANPHAVPTERKLAAGDLVVIDYGARHNGYISDITRTFGIAEVSQEKEQVHQIVVESNAAGRAAARPGLPCSTVDQAARQVIEEAGYGQYFIHRTGHGIGMEAHEGPYIRDPNPMLLEPGMTFTVEPGIYLPDRFGVRIEDNVVITKGGLRSLTNLPRPLQIIGS
jgi:Xaa-Pro dipeptidase